MLANEEYIEQAYLFRSLGERMSQRLSTQDLLESLKDEILSTTRLPLAIDFMVAELRFNGAVAPAMARLRHYFAPFQTFLVQEAENDRARFDFNMAMEVLRLEAEYRGQGPLPQGMFLYQFEVLCRNRLGYNPGLDAMAGDPLYDETWRRFILDCRRKIGVIDIADLVYVHSRHYLDMQRRLGKKAEVTHSILFDEKEGKIALANRRRDPLLLFSALQRHLNYPRAPRRKPRDETQDILPTLLRRVQRLEVRLKMVEEETRKGGIDLERFYERAKGGEDLDELLGEK